MTDRLKGFTVVLTTDIREDDAEEIAQAIRMIKGVLEVQPVTANSGDWMNRQRVRSELGSKIMAVLREEAGTGG
jgi:hypothetical protein